MINFSDAIRKFTDNIRVKPKGKDVRKDIADSIDALAANIDTFNLDYTKTIKGTVSSEYDKRMANGVSRAVSDWINAWVADHGSPPFYVDDSDIKIEQLDETLRNRTIQVFLTADDMVADQDLEHGDVCMVMSTIPFDSAHYSDFTGGFYVIKDLNVAFIDDPDDPAYDARLLDMFDNKNRFYDLDKLDPEGNKYLGAFLILDSVLKNNSDLSTNETAASIIADTALSYISHRDDFTYGIPTNFLEGYDRTYDNNDPYIDNSHGDDPAYEEYKTASKLRRMICSAFAMNCIFGIDYDHSKYVLIPESGQVPAHSAPNNIPNNALCQDWTLLNMFSYTKINNNNRPYNMFYTQHMAKHAAVAGYGFRPAPDLSNLQTGDLLFMRPASGTSDNWQGISHSAVYAYSMNNNYSKIWEMSGGFYTNPDNPSKTLDYGNPIEGNPRLFTMQKSTLYSRIVFAARFPFRDQNSLNYKNYIISTMSNATRTVVHKTDPSDPNKIYKNQKYLLYEPIRPNKQYTAILKATFTPGIDNHWPTLTDCNENNLQVIASYGGTYNATEKPRNDIYVIPFSVSSNLYQIGVSLRGTGTADLHDDDTFVINSFEVYEGMIFDPGVVMQRRYDENRLYDILSPSWRDIDFDSAASGVEGWIKAFKYGPMVNLHIYISGGLTAGTVKKIGEMPAGYRPVQLISTDGRTTTFGSANFCRVTVQPDGDIYIVSSTTDANVDVLYFAGGGGL